MSFLPQIKNNDISQRIEILLQYYLHYRITNVLVQKSFLFRRGMNRQNYFRYGRQSTFFIHPAAEAAKDGEPEVSILLGSIFYSNKARAKNNNNITTSRERTIMMRRCSIGCKTHNNNTFFYWRGVSGIYFSSKKGYEWKTTASMTHKKLHNGGSSRNELYMIRHQEPQQKILLQGLRGCQQEKIK